MGNASQSLSTTATSVVVRKNGSTLKEGCLFGWKLGLAILKMTVCFVGRRDQPKSFGMPRVEFVERVSEILEEMQQGLYDKALKLRVDNTQQINSFDEFKAFFTPENEAKPEVHGGFAECYFVDCPETDEMLVPLKVTPRCTPVDRDVEPGVCIFTGKPTRTRGIFAKSY